MTRPAPSDVHQKTQSLGTRIEALLDELDHAGSSVIMFNPLVLSTEEQSALHVFGNDAVDREQLTHHSRLGKWMARGPGPVALTGGEWISGVALCPAFRFNYWCLVACLSWKWEADKLGEWLGHSELRLMLLDVGSKACWTLDVTSKTESTVIVPRELNLSANCAVVLQLKAGERVGKLYRPPFVKCVEIEVRYRF
jgi:hypothetical protein